MFKSLSLIFVALFVQGALSVLEFEGQCPEVKLLDSFDVDAYMGKWYGSSRLPQQAPNVDEKKCANAFYTNLGDNKVLIEASSIDVATGESMVSSWDGFYLGVGSFSFLFDANRTEDVANYNVIAVAYDKWAAVYNCVNLSESTYTLEVHTLSRTVELDEDSEALARQALADQGVDTSLLIPYNQDGC